MADTLIAGGVGYAASSATTDTDAVWNGELTAFESRAEIDSLDDLQTRRRQLMPEYAALRALHGSFGKWDARRKQMLSAIQVSVRMEARQREEKVTEAYVEQLAHADDRYAQLVEDGIVGATRYYELETEISEIEEKIRNRELCILAFNAEAKLAR